MIKKQAENIEFTHKGITVYLHISYVDNDVSMLESNGDKKRWVFSDRGREYMQGWLDILEAMAEATKYAKAQLDAYYKQKEKENEKLMSNIRKNASKNG